MRPRTDPLAIPFDRATTRRTDMLVRPTVGHVSPDPVPHDVAVDYSALDRPTVLRRETPTGWLELDPDVRAEIRDIALAQLEKRLGDARVKLTELAANGLATWEAVRRVARLERSVEMVRGWA